MTPYRPAAVLVIAILNLVFGSFFLLWFCCGVGASVGLYFTMQNLPPSPPGQPKALELAIKVFEVVPSYGPFLIASLVVGLVFDVVLLVSGVGLLKMRLWAWYGSIAYAIFGVLNGFVGTAYNVFVYTPAMAQVFAKGALLKRTMDEVRRFCFLHGLYGKDAKSADAVGIEFPDGSVLGSKAAVKLRFDAKYMGLAAARKL